MNVFYHTCSKLVDLYFIYKLIMMIIITVPSPVEHQICPAVCVLMKLSFDEEHRHAMNELGMKTQIYLFILLGL